MELLTALQPLLTLIPGSGATTVTALIAGITLALHLSKVNLSGATTVSDAATKLVQAQGAQIDALTRRLDSANARLDAALEKFDQIELENAVLLRRIGALELLLRAHSVPLPDYTRPGELQ